MQSQDGLVGSEEEGVVGPARQELYPAVGLAEIALKAQGQASVLRGHAA